MIPTLTDEQPVTITEELVADRLESDFWPLLVRHREELTTNKALMELAPDIARYRGAESAGALVALVARAGGSIVGYSFNFVGPHLHYMRLRVAENDVLFTLPEWRERAGGRLLVATKRACKARGARVMAWHAKPGTALEAILRKRARVQDIVFTEEL